MTNEDVVRELDKISDTLLQVKIYLGHKDNMNAALHMSTVRYTPLYSAVANALASVVNMSTNLSNESL